MKCELCDCPEAVGTAVLVIPLRTFEGERHDDAYAILGAVCHSHTEEEIAVAIPRDLLKACFRELMIRGTHPIVEEIRVETKPPGWLPGESHIEALSSITVEAARQKAQKARYN